MIGGYFVHIVLVEPEIPQNTGNIVRTCAVTGSHLHLVRPLGFSTEDKYLKRAGLDYWHLVDIEYHDNFQQLQEKYADGNYYFATTKATKIHTKVKYANNDFLVFGSETRGLSKEILVANKEYCIRVPMLSEARCLNLANSVAVILYEALRQVGFPNLR
ncbi:tRNA (uridine(34)/cytosine(34)/5-carboxymethylaminomethyluridine(34)-2'-O)-methyltransferase TrmL [Bacillota bacterium LX-D]|nr:tRNA (uridine(34)/cytosine(34)/5-carboxymethylaminomethyluridine(34)-2'-O)-methyltransferase TrmL [Bacillota bacterium LX-D]